MINAGIMSTSEVQLKGINTDEPEFYIVFQKISIEYNKRTAPITTTCHN
jgi:hypothetical protein